MSQADPFSGRIPCRCSRMISLRVRPPHFFARLKSSVRWLGILVLSCGIAIAEDGLALVPWPSAVECTGGRLTLAADARIVARSPELTPLADVLAAELKTLTGRRTIVSKATDTRAGDIVLAIDPELGAEHYRLEVDDRARVSGGSYAGVAEGTVTLLQALATKGDAVDLPEMTLTDSPAASYRGLMLDPARCWHSIETLKQCIVLCRWYKIRFLQLHLTDDQSFTFPSTSYPKLATPERHYSLEQLRELERFARVRAVVILPEFDLPGHSAATVRAMPGLFGASPGSGSTINFAREDVYDALDTVIGEMLDVFRSTPYFHIGGDECQLRGLDRNPDFQEAFKQLGIGSQDELYRHFLARMDGIVKKHGKRMIVWEGFRRGGKTDVPRDILVMAFEGGKYYRPDLLALDGYTVINTSWQPLYVVTRRPAPIGQWPVEHIYGWNMFRWEHFRKWAPAYEPIQLPQSASVLGAQLCSWENPQETVIPSVRKRLAAMSERIWNPQAARSFDDFTPRMKVTDAGLSALLGGVPAGR